MSRFRVAQAFALSIVMFTGFVLAQTDEGEGTGLTAEEEVEVRRRANLSPEEQRQQGVLVVQRGEDLSRRVQSMLDEARQERDIIRVTCVNDKLTQVNANLRTAQQRFEQLNDAIAANDSGRRNHEFTVLIVLDQKFVVLDREAAQCIGQDIYETGATRVTTEIDPETPELDPTILPEVEVPVMPYIPPPRSGDR